MKLLPLIFLFFTQHSIGQQFVSNRSCIWQDSSILYNRCDNYLEIVPDISVDSASCSFGELTLTSLPDRITYKTISNNSSKNDTLHFFSNGLELGQQYFQIRNTGQDTLSWWNHNGTISRAQLIENKPFMIRNKSGYNHFSRIIGINYCQYQEPGSILRSFPICDSTWNEDTKTYEWIEGTYNGFAGDKFPDCLISALQSLPIGTIIHFNSFKTICPDCVARNRTWIFQVELVE